MVFYFDIIFLSVFNFIFSRRFLIYNTVSLIIEIEYDQYFIHFVYAIFLFKFTNIFLSNLKYKKNTNRPGYGMISSSPVHLVQSKRD